MENYEVSLQRCRVNAIFLYYGVSILKYLAETQRLRHLWNATEITVFFASWRISLVPTPIADCGRKNDGHLSKES